MQEDSMFKVPHDKKIGEVVKLVKKKPIKQSAAQVLDSFLKQFRAMKWQISLHEALDQRMQLLS